MGCTDSKASIASSGVADKAIPNKELAIKTL